MIAERSAACASCSSRKVGDQYAFIAQLWSRIDGRIQLSTDGYREYPPAIRHHYGGAIDFAQIIKPARPTTASSLGHLKITKRSGTPDPKLICTSFVGRHNLTIRQQLRRFTLMSLGFSKKLKNLRAAFSIYAAHYNFRSGWAVRAGVFDARRLVVVGLYSQFTRLS